jgi:hypothetical protein
LVFVLTRVYQAIPRVAYKIQQFIERTGKQISRLVGLMAEPVLRIHAFWATAQSLVRLTRKSTHE